MRVVQSLELKISVKTFPVLTFIRIFQLEELGRTNTLLGQISSFRSREIRTKVHKNRGIMAAANSWRRRKWLAREKTLSHRIADYTIAWLKRDTRHTHPFVLLHFFDIFRKILPRIMREWPSMVPLCYFLIDENLTGCHLLSPLSRGIKHSRAIKSWITTQL